MASIIRINHDERSSEYQNYSSNLSLTSALDEVDGQRHAPAALPPGQKSGTHCIEGWVGSRYFFFRNFEFNGVNIHLNPSIQVCRKDCGILTLDIAMVKTPGRDKECPRICDLLGVFYTA